MPTTYLLADYRQDANTLIPAGSTCELDSGTAAALIAAGKASASLPRPPGADNIARTSDAAGAVNLAPYIFIPKGLGRFEKALSVAGAVFNGVADDAAAMQTALDTFTERRHQCLHMPPDVPVIKLNSGITINTANKQINGHGTKIDFSGMTSGAAVTLTQTSQSVAGTGNQTYGNIMSGLEFFHFKGPGSGTQVDGVLFTGGTALSPDPVWGSARTVLSRSNVEGFRKGITWHHRSYLTTVMHCEIMNNRLGLHLKGGGVDAYENQRVIGGVIGNNDHHIYVEDGQLYIVGTSVDYGGSVQWAVRVGLLSFTDVHWEYPVQGGGYGFSGGIYSGPSPLCAGDMAPGLSGVSTLASDMGFNSTTAAAADYAAFVMRGGLWASMPGTTGRTLVTHINTRQGATVSFGGRIKTMFNGTVPSSGYLAHGLSTWDTPVAPGSYTGNVEWEPSIWAGDDVPHTSFENPAYITTNPNVGLSISPMHNEMVSYGVSITANPGFEGGSMLEDLFIMADTATITSRLTGTNGSAAHDGTEGALSGTKCLKFTKVGAAGTTLKFGIKVPLRFKNSRPTFRGYMRKDGTSPPTTGSMNVNIVVGKLTPIPTGTAFSALVNRYGWVDSYSTIPGSAASSGSPTNAKNNSAFKFGNNSMYVPTDSGTTANDTWVPFQLGGNADVPLPGWATDMVIEFDLTAMGPGVYKFDCLDLQWF